MPIRITGLNSGLDTEAIISALVSSYSYKTDKYKKAQTKLSWKQDAWKSLNTKIYSLYKNVGNLRLSSAYNMKSSTVSDSSKVTVKAGSGSVNGSYSIQVTSLAKAGYLTGARLDSGIKASSKLSDLGYTGTEEKIAVIFGGNSTDITVSNNDTIQDVVNQLKEAGVNASYDETNRRIYVSAKDSGTENDFALSGSDDSGKAALTALGLNVESTANTAEYEALAKYSSLSLDDMKQLVADKQAATAENVSLKKTNAYYQNAIAYANASEAIQTLGSGKDASEYTLLKSLVSADTLENKYVDADNNFYTYDSKNGTYTTSKTISGGTYDETTKTYTAADGTTYTQGIYNDADGTFLAHVEQSDDTGLTKASEVYDTLTKSYFAKKDENGVIEKDDNGETVVDTEALAAFKNNLSTVKTIAQEAEINGSEMQNMLKDAETALANGTISDFVTASENAISANKAIIEKNDATLAANEKLNADMTEDDLKAFKAKADYAKQVVDGTVTPTYSTDATRVNGADAIIYVNGAKYTGSSNSFSINGLTITATGVTGTTYDATETSAVTATVNTDVQGIYDKVKDFLTQYNALINEMTSLYNADSAKGYDPLTDEEKDSMSDTEVEKWEEKIKSSLLRRDDTLSSIMNAMTSAMSKAVEIDGKNYYLSNFGIKTLGYLNAAENEQNAYQIDGDEDDVATSGNTDKLMAAITNDPDTVLEFMQGLATNLYDAVDQKMKSTTMRSTYTVYNDKEMASEYSDYTDLIKKWEEKLTAQEDYYYEKFSAMETALAKLNSQTSSLTGLFG